VRISAVLPVLNEASLIAQVLAHLRASAPPDGLEIIVADGGSADGTAEAASGADTVIVTERGRARQMHAGAVAATGDILLFLHADTRLPEGWHGLLARVFAGGATWTAFPLFFDHGSRAYRWIERVTRLRFRLTGVPHGDQAMAVRREAYFAVGGFPDVPLMEEYYLARKLKRLGPARLLPAPVLTSARRYEKNGPLLNAVRNSFLVALFHAGVPPAALARLYR
jgi:rSAM/selenodomain-associated transferase 2